MQRLNLHSAIFHSILAVKGSFYTLKRVEPINYYLKHLFVVPEESLMKYSRSCEPDESSTKSSSSSAVLI